MNSYYQIRVWNGATSPPCDADGRFAWVQHQIRQATLGLIESLACPYCGSNVILGAEKLCCEPISQATAIVLYDVEARDLCETGDLAVYSSDN